LADYFPFVAQGLAAQGFAEPFSLLAFLVTFLPLSSALAAQGFFAAQGFCAAQGFFAAQGFAWANPKPGAAKKEAATKANIKRTDFLLIKPSFFAVNYGLNNAKTGLAG
jgi:hypothetical protein